MVDGILVGDGNMKISNICTIQKSKPGSIAFYYNKKYSNHLATSEASAIIAKEKDFIKIKYFKDINLKICTPRIFVRFGIDKYYKNWSINFELENKGCDGIKEFRKFLLDFETTFKTSLCVNCSLDIPEA